MSGSPSKMQIQVSSGQVRVTVTHAGHFARGGGPAEATSAKTWPAVTNQSLEGSQLHRTNPAVGAG